MAGETPSALPASTVQTPSPVSDASNRPGLMPWDSGFPVVPGRTVTLLPRHVRWKGRGSAVTVGLPMASAPMNGRMVREIIA